ncbi:MAG: hypothetical protein OER21_01065 [Gemmatimonadota bacterium]|nr:hypothetical protein [Gemmatimonadota bacterium]
MCAMMTEAWLYAQVTPDLAPQALPAVTTRVACPHTGGIKRVRLAMDPLTGRPAVTWCGRFGAAAITCEEECLQPADTIVAD